MSQGMGKTVGELAHGIHKYVKAFWTNPDHKHGRIAVICVIMVLVVAAVFGLGYWTGYSFGDTDMHTRDTELIKQNADLKYNNKSLSKKVKDLNSDNDRLESDLADVRQDDDDLKAQVEKLKQGKTDLDKKESDLQSQLSQARSDLQSQKQQSDSLQQQLNVAQSSASQSSGSSSYGPTPDTSDSVAGYQGRIHTGAFCTPQGATGINQWGSSVLLQGRPGRTAALDAVNGSSLMRSTLCVEHF